jgi:hypothetical protein
MAQRGIGESASFAGGDVYTRYRTRGRRRAIGNRPRRGYMGRVGLGMLLLAVIVDLVVFELTNHWSSGVDPDPSDLEAISRDGS